jgi:threonine dehydratase
VGEPHTIAEGIPATVVFDYMLPLFRENLAGVYTVSDEEIKATLGHILGECHAVAEPGGASSLAAAAKHRGELRDPIACVVSGGNASPLLFSGLLSAGG